MDTKNVIVNVSSMVNHLTRDMPLSINITVHSSVLMKFISGILTSSFIHKHIMVDIR